jgi:CHAD domain-containing protein
VVADQDREPIKDKLRWLAQELGPARDLDVFAADVLEPLRAAHPDDAELTAAHRDFMERRAAAYARAIDAVGSGRFRSLLLDLAAWIEIGDWAQEDNTRAGMPIGGHAASELSRLRRKIKKKGRVLGDLTAAERHKLRIRAKRLRYATEFFAATFPGKKSDKRRKKSLAALEDIQDALGALNDIAVRQALLAAGEGSGQLCAPSADKAEAEKRLKQAERAYERFAKVKPFWKT